VVSFAQRFVFAIPILLPILCEESEIVIRRGQRDEELTDKLEFWPHGRWERGIGDGGLDYHGGDELYGSGGAFLLDNEALVGI
jgi:hypothetical protein